MLICHVEDMLSETSKIQESKKNLDSSHIKGSKISKVQILDSVKVYKE